MLNTSSQKQLVDLRQLQCPMTLLMAKKALAELEKEQLLELKLNDAVSCDDVLRYARKSGHQLCRKLTADDEITLTFKKSSAAC